MYLMYVDESGDTGLLSNGSPTRYFILSAIVIHESSWYALLQNIISFRRNLKATKGVLMREEIHATPFISRPGNLVRLRRNDRLDILKKCLDWVASNSDISVITVAVDKQNKTTDHIFELAWERLIQRFENTIVKRNFPHSSQKTDEYGMIISDNTDNRKLKGVIRKMRRHNPIPNNSGIFTSGYRNLKITKVIEDPFLKDSSDSYFHQMVDVIAYFAKQHFEPNEYIRRKGATNFYERLLPVINPYVSTGRLHIVVA